MSLMGADGLRARLRAIQEVPAWAGRQWAEETVRITKSRVPVKSGKSRDSVRVGETRGDTSAVVGSRTLDFIDAGSRAHDITAKGKTLKFNSGGMTLFRKKVHKPRIAGRPFKRQSAEEGLEKIDIGRELISRWNRAA